MRKKSSILVRNENAHAQFSSLSFNSVPADCRMETLEGREHLVVPMVILTEGVHNGTQGPLYYPKDELAKHPAAWNHKPIVVYHPTLNGRGISACEPVVLNTRKVGIMLNTKFDKKKSRLTSEAWIERARADLVDERVTQRIDNAEMMELSTGLFIDAVMDEGSWKEEDYSGIARNFKPDHLALLPDMTGACSIKDGAGLLRNAANADFTKLKPKDRKAFLSILEMSYGNVQMALTRALKEYYNIPEGSYSSYIYICDVYSDFFIYDWNGKTYRLGYKSTDSGVELIDDEEPVEVFKVSSYKTLDGTVVGNKDKQPNEGHMNKKKVIAILMANGTTVLNGVKLSADMPDTELNKLNDEQLEAELNAAFDRNKAKPAAPAANTAPAAPAVTAPPVVPAQPAPAANNIVSLDQFIAAAPPQVREVLTNAIANENAEKARIVGAIMQNTRNPFSKEQLEAKTLAELKQIAALAAPEQTAPANYSGQAPTHIGNTNKKVEALPIPIMNFDKPAAVAK